MTEDIRIEIEIELLGQRPGAICEPAVAEMAPAQSEDASVTYQQVAIDADATYAPLSDAGNRPPAVRFELLSPTVMVAHPPGASIRCELEEWDCSHVVIRSTLREHIARVTVHPEHGDAGDVTEETIAIASALYWSWWRAQDMRGVAP